MSGQPFAQGLICLQKAISTLSRPFSDRASPAQTRTRIHPSSTSLHGPEARGSKFESMKWTAPSLTFDSRTQHDHQRSQIDTRAQGVPGEAGMSVHGSPELFDGHDGLGSHNGLGTSRFLQLEHVFGCRHLGPVVSQNISSAPSTTCR
ncbi:hypothetical protein PG990_000003 [Apiospora arundinis]